MSKFIFIDHSLRRVGGHHFEYAVQLLEQAQLANFEVVVATHRDFQRDWLPENWQVFPLFRYDVYNKYAIPWNRTRKRFPAADSTPERSNRGSWLRRLRDSLAHLDQVRRLASFRSACEQLVSNIDLRVGDIAFAATISSFDFEGLTSFLHTAPDTEAATWHVQFHHDILEGRTADYDRQLERLKAIRRLYANALDRVPNHRIVFHTTTASLADGFNQLDVGQFQELPYPVGMSFHSTNKRPSSNDTSRPKNITCAGGMRREKGSRELIQLIKQLWQPNLQSQQRIATGESLQLRIQASKKRFRQLCRALPKPPSDNSLRHVPHPLAMNDYHELIRTSDVGLFLYDSWSYYARCSGILVEMLAAGIPVIVPAAYWLAKQIEEPIYRHLDRLLASVPIAGQSSGADIIWTGNQSSDPSVAFNKAEPLSARLKIPDGAASLILRFRFPTGTKEYTKLRISQQLPHGESVHASTTVHGPHEDIKLPVGALAPLRGNAQTVELSLSNAFTTESICVTDVCCSFISRDGSSQERLPEGSVGLVAADVHQLPRLIANMVEHYDHYRRTAQTYADQWVKVHSVKNTFATLLKRNDDAASALTARAA